MIATVALATEKPGDDPLQWLRDSIPGEPGTDYPIYNTVESTSFSCEGRVFGGKFHIDYSSTIMSTQKATDLNSSQNCPHFYYKIKVK